MRRRLVRMSAVVLLLVAGGCERHRGSVQAAEAMTGGDAERGRALLRSYGCQTCHTIPGVDGADGLVGPPLAGIADRAYIAGVLPNAPDNMLRWIRDPRAVDSLTAMPNTGVTSNDARHIAAYLYSLH
ncbi:MAG TPA: c-type cytochrome [Gemmatimonadaceae bacterium]